MDNRGRQDTVPCCTMDAAKRTTQQTIHGVIKFTYLSLIIVLAVLWPSFSLFFLVFLHMAALAFSCMTRQSSTPCCMNWLDKLAFHFESTSTIMNKAHFALLIGTFLSFFHYYENNGSVVSIKFPRSELDKLTPSGMDHSSLGISNGKLFSSFGWTSLKPADLAQQVCLGLRVWGLVFKKAILVAIVVLWNMEHGT